LDPGKTTTPNLLIVERIVRCKDNKKKIRRGAKEAEAQRGRFSCIYHPAYNKDDIKTTIYAVE
jgi:hypothetical protein